METEDRSVVERPVRPLDRRTTRRDAVKAGAAVAVGVAAAGYVKPTLRGLGVPVALATSGSQPPPTTAPKCSINVALSGVSCSSVGTFYTITGSVSVTTDATSGECCPVAAVSLYAMDQTPGDFGGCNTSQLTASPTVAAGTTITGSGTKSSVVLGSVGGNTGGSNPIQIGTCLPSQTSGYTFSFTTSVAGEPLQVVIEVTLADSANGQTYQYCTAANC